MTSDGKKLIISGKSILALAMVAGSILALPLSGNAQADYTAGVANFKMKNYKHAEELLFKHLRKYPNDVKACFYAALSAHKLGKKTKAIGLYKRVVQLSPNSNLGLRARSVLAKVDPRYAMPVVKSPSDNAKKSAPTRIPFQSRDGKLYVNAIAHGKPLLMRFDPDATAGGLMSEDRIKALGISTGDSDTVRIDISVGPITRKSMHISVASGQGTAILGAGFFTGRKFELDQKTKTILVTPR